MDTSQTFSLNDALIHDNACINVNREIIAFLDIRDFYSVIKCILPDFPKYVVCVYYKYIYVIFIHKELFSFIQLYYGPG